MAGNQREREREREREKTSLYSWLDYYTNMPSCCYFLASKLN
jgi:hypothetical protein